MKKVCLSIVLVSALCCQLVFGADTLTLNAKLRDQAPATMIHKNYPENYWKYNGWTDNPQNGSAGTANGGKGFDVSDFEYPLFWYGNIRTPDAKGGILSNGEAGLVGNRCNATNNWKNCGMTDSDRKPVYQYPGASPLNTVLSPTSFNDWFHDTPQNVMMPYDLVLTNSGGRTYTYAQTNFFPFDGLGWNDWNCVNNDCKIRHNYGWTMEIHGSFAYQGGETFYFSGDDDVWVFLDRRLVIDLGGIHTELSAQINLDEIAGLIKGYVYQFDFFYAERHTTVSQLKITTSIQITCTYFDHCGVCEGDGQSCCQKGYDCNDNNACTADACAILVPPAVGCVNTPITCNNTNKCQTVACDKVKGCVPTPITCNDDNACTLDTCVTATGCSFAAISCPGDKCNPASCDPKTGCFNTKTNCNDSNACTTDTCDAAKGCSNVAITCNDNNKCTNDACDPVKGCVFTPIACNDSNACTRDSCVPASGCLFESITCNDNDACTQDSCSPTSGCVYNPTGCDDSNMCTIDSCDKATGCVHANVNCNDFNVCTIDNCVASLGCTHSNVSCDDANVCTIDTCNPVSGCSNEAIVCNDNNACTVDTCDKVKGCVFTPITCNDNNACTTDSCDVKSGCVFAPVSCNDKNACTNDTCDVSKGCQYAQISCDDKNACTVDKCDVNTGCGYTPLSCDDGKACTTDKCDTKNGCQYTLVSCDDNNKCTNDMCSNSTGCQYNPVVCDDKDPCTTDSCAPLTGCVYTPVACDLCSAHGQIICTPKNGNYCLPQECDPTTGSCSVKHPVNCDDNNVCTNDVCNSATGVCSNTAISCDDNNKCTVDTCDTVTGCKHNDIVCNDNNPCTVDSCSLASGACMYNATSKYGITCGSSCCEWTDPCSPKTCVNNVCTVKPVNCDDDNECTIDTCYVKGDVGLCNNTARTCANADACNPQTCNTTTGVCDIFPVKCDDGNACTSDSCSTVSGKAQCVFKNNPCPSDPCSPQTCNTTSGQCFGKPVVCDDGNACTDDSCVASGGVASCKFTPRPCVTTDLCNPKSCDAKTGICDSKPVLCDDANLCTNDTCITSGGVAKCSFEPFLCNNEDKCNPQSCSEGQCKATAINCDDQNLCTVDSCKNDASVAEGYKCMHDLISCSSFNTGDLCTPAVCNASVGCQPAERSICDDFNPCTVDECVGVMNCTNTLGACDDNNECTVDSCDSTQSSLEKACVYQPLNCSVAPNPCLVSTTCMPKSGCNFTAVTCPEPADWCQIAICDEKIGCWSFPKACTDKDLDCYIGECNSNEKTCKYKERDDFTTATTSQKGGITCFLAYKQAEAAGIIAGGAIAGIVVGAVIFAALAALGARQAYMWAQMRGGAMGGAQGNPLYMPSQNHNENPLFNT